MIGWLLLCVLSIFIVWEITYILFIRNDNAKTKTDFYENKNAALSVSLIYTGLIFLFNLFYHLKVGEDGYSHIVWDATIKGTFIGSIIILPLIALLYGGFAGFYYLNWKLGEWINRDISVKKLIKKKVNKNKKVKKDV